MPETTDRYRRDDALGKCRSARQRLAGTIHGQALDMIARELARRFARDHPGLPPHAAADVLLWTSGMLGGLVLQTDLPEDQVLNVLAVTADDMFKMAPDGDPQGEGEPTGTGRPRVEWAHATAREYQRRHGAEDDGLVVLGPCPDGTDSGEPCDIDVRNGYAIEHVWRGVSEWRWRQPVPTPEPTDA